MSRNADHWATKDLFLVDVESGCETRITANNNRDSPADFSADGLFLYYLSAKNAPVDLRKRNLENGGDEFILPLGSKGGDGTITHDENTVIFIDDPVKPYFYEIFACDIDGSNIRQLSFFGWLHQRSSRHLVEWTRYHSFFA